MRAIVAILTAALLVPWQGAFAARWDVTLRDCSFRPGFRAVSPHDTVTWRYNEGACPLNHRIQTWGDSPFTFDSSPSCASEVSPSLDCMGASPKKTTYTVRFSLEGTYDVKYFCLFHGELSGDDCNGMCGVVHVQAAGATQTASPTPSPTATRRTPTPTVTASSTATPTGTPTGTVTPTASPTGTSTVIAGGPQGSADGGAGRALVAVAAIAVLGSLGFLVWRSLIAQR